MGCFKNKDAAKIRKTNIWPTISHSEGKEVQRSNFLPSGFCLVLEHCLIESCAFKSQAQWNLALGKWAPLIPIGWGLLRKRMESPRSYDYRNKDRIIFSLTYSTQKSWLSSFLALKRILWSNALLFHPISKGRSKGPHLGMVLRCSGKRPGG